MSPLGADDPKRLRDLLDAVLSIGSDLALPHILRNLVETAIELVDATYGAIGVLSETGEGLSEFVEVGIPPDQLDAIGHLPKGHGILGLLIVDPRPLRLADLNCHPDSFGFPPHHPPMRSFLGVPIRGREWVLGNLYLTEKRFDVEFSEEDMGLAVGLASAAAIAIDNARLHARLRDLNLIEDRARVAADLHDVVIQRLFAIGLTLEGAVKAISQPDVARRVGRAVDDLDDTIRQVRSTIFGLQLPRFAGSGVRAGILDQAAETATILGFSPDVRLDGPIDASVDGVLASHVLAVLGEALTNVVRHAAATRVEIRIAVDNDQITIAVCDNGVGAGLAARPGGLGLPDLRRRAHDLGGEMTITSVPEGTGTIMTWRAPLSSGVD